MPVYRVAIDGVTGTVDDEATARLRADGPRGPLA
jgi:hypothetical protein